MLRLRITSVVALSIVASVSARTSQVQAPAITPVDEPEAYVVYAALLPNEWIVRAAKATNLVIQEETATMSACMPSGPPMEGEWKPVLMAYREANASKHSILAGKAIGFPYQTVPWKVIEALFQPPAGLDGWKEFSRRYPDSGGFLQVSAVGFDPGKNRAMVYMAHSCGSLCGGGTHHLLERVQGVWREPRIANLQQCSWVS